MAAGCDGVVRREELLGAGVSAGVIKRRLRDGTLSTVGRGIYIVGALRSDRTPWRVAAWTVRGGALSHSTAARHHRLLGVEGVDPATRLHVVAPRSAHRPDLAELVLHRTTHLPSADLESVDGLSVTTVARTICDLASIVGQRRFRRMVEQNVVAKRCDVGELLACRSAYVRRGRSGSARLNLVFDELLNDEPLPASELERRMSRLLVEERIPGFVPQFRPPWFDGRRGVVDFANERAKVIIEVDGRRWHGTTQDFDEDRRRDRRAQAEGWVVLRFSWYEVVHRPAAVAEEIAAIVTARI